MPDRGVRGVVSLDQCEGRARDFEVFFACQGADQGTGKNCLAAAQGAAQQNDLAGVQQGRDIRGKAGCGLFGIGLNLNGKFHAVHYITPNRLWLWGRGVGKMEI